MVGIYSHFTTNLVTNLPIKEFYKSDKISLSYRHEFDVFILGHGVGLCIGIVNSLVGHVTLTTPIWGCLFDILIPEAR